MKLCKAPSPGRTLITPYGTFTFDDNAMAILPDVAAQRLPAKYRVLRSVSDESLLAKGQSDIKQEPAVPSDSPASPEPDTEGALPEPSEEPSQEESEEPKSRKGRGRKG